MVTFALVMLAGLITMVGVALVLALRAKGEKCTTCGTRLPKGAVHCPNCGSQLASGASGNSASEHIKPPAGSVELVATQGPLASQRFPVPPQGLTIGRHPDNDIVLADEFMVSRQHAVITLEQGQYVLYDRDSTNGTWVNDQRIFRQVLKPGDRIQIWQSQFAFSMTGVSFPLPPLMVAQAPVVQVVGEWFDGHFLESLIGRGGMSEVFKARDPNGKTVAIKILQEMNPYLVNKFEQEGNQIGPLLRGHPNIVYVYGFHHSLDGRLYFVMEFVDAPSLRKVMQQPLSETEAVTVVGQVCSALSFAHKNGIVHRDIKPENILVTPSGQVKVLDFGIAKLTSASTVTQDKIVGTPEYISPEQARGNPVCPASDVYSLGIVLYEMLTGSVPFRRPNIEDPLKAAMEVIRQHIRDSPDPIRKRNPNAQVSAHLEQVTMRALKKAIKERYSTAKEMGEDLGYSDLISIVLPQGSFASACLVILQGPRQGQRIPLANRSLALGRFELGSPNTAISRHHANIILRGDRYWLQDMSKNGTWVDNQRVFGEIPLRTGAVIVIGENVLRVEPCETN
jgi:serine/threonine protein kinase